MYGLKFLVLCFFSVSVFAAPRDEERVKVSLYYESMCKKSHQYFVEELYPTYLTLGDVLDVELVPYGKATRHQENGTWVINCHHGAAECYSDKFQACVINKEYTPGQTLDFVYCMLTGQNDESTASECVDRGMLDWPSLNTCANSEEGSNLLAALGEKQDALPEKLRFMPWILINDVFDEEVYQQARSDLLGLVCGLLSNKPSDCDGK